MADIAENLYRVRERIRLAAERAGRDPSQITLIAVAKTFPASSVSAVHRLGVANIGENRVEEAALKIQRLEAQVGPTIVWHMVGHVQRRKAHEAVSLFEWIHSVDGLPLAAKLDERAAALGKRLRILVEVNVSGEPSKYGLAPEPRAKLESTIAGVLTLGHLDVRGLMTVAPIVSKPEQARPYFRALRELRDQLRSRFPDRTWEHLSMGMTDDFEAAIAEGATMLRIGRAIFGPRH